jgi:hypothetical protein
MASKESSATLVATALVRSTRSYLDLYKLFGPPSDDPAEAEECLRLTRATGAKLGGAVAYANTCIDAGRVEKEDGEPAPPPLMAVVILRKLATSCALLAQVKTYYELSWLPIVRPDDLRADAADPDLLSWLRAQGM